MFSFSFPPYGVVWGRLVGGPLVAGVCASVVSPCCVAVEVLQQVFSGVLEFVANHPEAEEPHSHAVLWVVGFGLLGAGSLLGDRLGAYREGQVDVGFDPSGVHRAVEHSEFYRAILPYRVEVEGDVSAVVVVLVSVAGVPIS